MGSDGHDKQAPDEQVPENQESLKKDPKLLATSISRQGATSGLDFMYRNWFLDYASYVILDRAIPNVEDGLKPVQRRILHALFELEDGRYNKAANVIGHTMRYHPHGDMAIGDAFIKMAQKELLVDMQGNWGNPLTGDRAAAARYIEGRLNPFALEILFNDATTEWQLSYDGRNKEPVVLPVKFPLLLALGVEGIAVGLATKILPHNFCELIRESIAVLQGNRPHLMPDFHSGGIADFSEYRDGRKGGKVRVRAVVEVVDPKTLCVRELPFGVTTSSLIDSILAAHEKGQIKIKKVEDNTAQEVEIMIHLPSGLSPDKAMQALYAFTDCEVSISPSCCVIAEGRPQFCSVGELLQWSTARTKQLLQRELEIEQEKIRAKLHFALLEQVFIGERIYRKLEKCEEWDEVLATLSKALKPFHKQFLREVTADDLNRLLEIKIKRITKYDEKRANEVRDKLQEELNQVEKNLGQMTRYAIDYFRSLLKRYGAGRQRKTRIEAFAKVKATTVAVSDQKLYVNRKEGFVGTGLKKDDYLCDCSKLDEVIAFCQDGTFMVSKVSDKTFFGKNIIWVGLFKRGDDRRIYHMIYRGEPGSPTLAKRFNITSLNRDKSYALTKDTATSRVVYFSVNPNGEAEKVKISLKAGKEVRKTQLSFDFANLPVKNRSALGVIVTKHAVTKVVQSLKGASTLGAQRIWFDRALGLLNTTGEGIYLGKFEGDEKLIAIYQSGMFEVLPCDLEQQFSEDLIEIQKWDAQDTIVSTIYFDAQRDDVFVKRVAVEDDSSGCRDFIPRSPGSKVLLATLKANPVVKAEFARTKKGVPPSALIKLGEFIDVKSFKSLGNKLSVHKITEVRIVREEV